jgi:hypothetical protein
MEAKQSTIDIATSRVIELEAELEASGNATTDAAELAEARAILHRWVDSVVAVVATPGVGRAVLMHANGSESRIASPELPALLSRPISWDAADQAGGTPPA